ncbi:hypothetical protein WA158_002840 [Blastocystis sp. Blastoise]
MVSFGEVTMKIFSNIMSFFQSLFRFKVSKENALEILSENDEDYPVTTPILPPVHIDSNTVQNPIAKVWIPFREELVSKRIFEERGELEYQSNELVKAIVPYCAHILLTNNKSLDLFLRPILPTDAKKCQKVISSKEISTNSLFLRFNRPIFEVPISLLTYLTNIDYEYHFAVAAGMIVNGKWELCGVARFIQERDDPQMAEWSAIVSDKYHGNRIGSSMLYYISRVAYSRGIRSFYAIVNPRNTTVLHWMTKLKGKLVQYRGVNVWTFTIPIYTEWILNEDVKQGIERSSSGSNLLYPFYENLIKQEVNNLPLFKYGTYEE